LNAPACQTSIIDLAFGPDGLLYVVALDEASWLAAEVLMSANSGMENCGQLGSISSKYRKRGSAFPRKRDLAYPDGDAGAG